MLGPVRGLYSEQGIAEHEMLCPTHKSSPTLEDQHKGMVRPGDCHVYHMGYAGESLQGNAVEHGLIQHQPGKLPSSEDSKPNLGNSEVAAQHATGHARATAEPLSTSIERFPRSLLTLHAEPRHEGG